MLAYPLLVLQAEISQAWRVLTRSYMKPEKHGKLLAYSPMLHARLFAQTSKMREKHFQPTRSSLVSVPEFGISVESSDVYLDGRTDVDRPLFVQFCANDPDELLAAARYVQPFCDAVDLNLGCPQGIARKGRYGAFLQEDQDLVYRLISKLHRELDVPVTAKIRILGTLEQTLAYAKNVLSAGASILTVHGRQRDQKGQNTGVADWSVIRYLRNHLPPETVLFANGNILQHNDISKCLEETGADGVMSAEGNLHDPAIFAGPPEGPEDRSYWRGRDGRGGYRVDAVFRRYLSIIYKYVLEVPEPQRPPLFHPSDPISDESAKSDYAETFEEPPMKRQKRGRDALSLSANLIAMRPHIFSLLRALIVVHTDVRDALATAHCGDMAAFERVLQMTETKVRDGLIDYETCPGKYYLPMNETSINMDSAITGSEGVFTARDSSLKTVNACKRPWWVCQPYVRPLPEEAIEKGALKLRETAATERTSANIRKVAAGVRSQSLEKLDIGSKDELVHG